METKHTQHSRKHEPMATRTERDHLREVNARLVEALEGVIASFEWHIHENGDYGMDMHRLDQARAALASAKGLK